MQRFKSGAKISGVIILVPNGLLENSNWVASNLGQHSSTIMVEDGINSSPKSTRERTLHQLALLVVIKHMIDSEWTSPFAALIFVTLLALGKATRRPLLLVVHT